MDDTLRSLIRNSILSARTDELMSLAKNTIEIKKLSTGEGAIGVSRIGGLPDLPVTIAWPQWDDRPLPLIAQIRLADITAYDTQGDLPRTGMLYFFFNEDAFDDYPPAPGSWQVVYYDGNNSDFRRITMQSEELHIYPPYVVNFFSRLTLPPFESVYMERLGFSYTAFQKDAPAEKRRDADAYTEILETLNDDISTHHQLLGYPYQIQGDLLIECQRDTGWLGEATDWQLLLQIDSDDQVDMMWGDVGVLYFYIPRQALRAHDFSQVHLVMQCC